jgi:hypothetical protein
VCERGGVGRVGGERGEERKRGGGAEAGVRDGGRHVGVPRARVAPQRQRVRGEEEEQLRGQGGAGAVARRRAVRDEAGRVQLTRNGGHLRGDGGGGRGGEVGGGGRDGDGDGVRAGGEDGQQREEVGGEAGRIRHTGRGSMTQPSSPKVFFTARLLLRRFSLLASNLGVIESAGQTLLLYNGISASLSFNTV